MANSKTTFVNDFDNDRQPEIASWPPIPEILISVKLRETNRNSYCRSTQTYALHGYILSPKIYNISRDISISGLVGHLAISGRLSLSQSFGDIFFEFAVT